MLEIKPEIIDIILLDKKYKNKENEIENLITKIYNLYIEITSLEHINFDLINVDKIYDLDYILTEEQIKKIFSLHLNNDEKLVDIILGIFSIIDNMQSILIDLEEHRLKNYDLKLMEHDIKNSEKQINLLKTNLEEATILNNENNIFKFNFLINMYKDFKENKTDAIANYKKFIEIIYFLSTLDNLDKEKIYNLNNLEDCKTNFELMYFFIFMNYPNKKSIFNLNKGFYEVNKKNAENLLNNIDYIFDKFCLINGYLLNSKKIYKSSALKIFNHVNNNLKVNKKPLTDKVSHLFSKLGIDINLDYRKSHNVRKIAIYDDYTIYDYSTNTKDTNLYISVVDLIQNCSLELKEYLELTFHSTKKEKNIELLSNKLDKLEKLLILHNINTFQNMYQQIKYVID